MASICLGHNVLIITARTDPALLKAMWFHKSNRQFYLINDRSCAKFAVDIAGDIAINTLRPRQNDRHFPRDIFKCIFLN